LDLDRILLIAYSAIIDVSKHEKTLEAIKKHPRPSNQRWAEVESLLLHYGAEIKEAKGSAIVVVLNGIRAVFHRPHPGDKADKGAIANALELLRKAGIREAREE
jgi:hypothetical protein